MSVAIPNGDATGRNRRTKRGMLWRVLAMLAVLPVILPVVGMMLVILAFNVVVDLGHVATAGDHVAAQLLASVRLKPLLHEPGNKCTSL